MDSNKIAEIIRTEVYENPMPDRQSLVDALADYFEADESLCDYKMRCQHPEHDFDRAAFLRIATGG